MKPFDLECGYAFETQTEADANADIRRIGGKAWPLEIEG